MKQTPQFSPPESLSQGYTIKDRKGVWYVSFSVRGEGQQRYSLGTKDRAEAERLAYQRWVHACMLVQNGQSLTNRGFSDVAEEFIATIEKDVEHNRKDGYHIARYVPVIRRYLIGYFGNRQIKAISASNIEGYWDRRRDYWVSEGFKMPNAQQLFQSSANLFTVPPSSIIPNPNLQPESVQNFEVGLRGEYDEGWFSVGGFYAKYDNFIRSLQAVPGQPNTYWSDNVESVNLWGIELAGEYEVYENLFASANVSWQVGRQQVSSGALETAFDGAVPLTAVLGVRYELPEHGLDFEVLGTFAAGPTERASPTTFKPEGYAIFDAFGHWKPNENVEISFGVQNIFDTAYFPNTLTGYDTVQANNNVKAQNPLELQRGPGRTFKVGTTVRF